MIVVVNVDPHAPRTTMVHLNLPALGLDWEDTFAVHDEITGQDWQWGEHNFVHLDPYHEPAHVLSVRSRRVTSRPSESGVLPSTSGDPTPAHFEQPDWFKTAVFYEVLVRSFKDSNGDGVGDFRGLTEKLDYLHWLGRRLPLGAAVLHLAAARRRLRHRRLHQHPARGRARSRTSTTSSTRRTSATSA